MAQLKNTVVNGSLKVNGRAETNRLITDDIKKTDGTSYVGNGTLTIKQGSQNYTFSANQDADQTITLESFNTNIHDTSHGTDIEGNFHSQLYLGSFNSAMKKVTKSGVVNYGLNPQFFSSMLVRLNTSSNGALSNLRDCISSLYSYLDRSQNNTYLTSHIGLLSIPSRTLEYSSEDLISPSEIENNSRPWIYSVIRNGDTNRPASSILFTDFIKTYVMNISDGTISRIAVDADTLGGKTSADFALSNHSHNYLPLSGGTLSGNLKLSADNKIATLSDANLLSYTSDNQVNIGYTAFDLKLQSNHKPVWYKFDGATESILTVGDWVQNTATADGYVTKGAGHPNKAWMTDNNGNPGWRDVITEDTNTWRPISINNAADFIGNNPLILKEGNNIRISKSQGTVTFDATVPSVSNYSLVSSLTNKQIDITLQKDSTNTNTISLNFTNSSIIKNSNKYTITTPRTPMNALNTAGSVAAPTAGTQNRLWGTDANGNPGWIAIRTFLCGISAISTPTTPVIFNSDYFAVNNQASGFTLSVKKADTATTANSAINATNAEHANSADTATTANSATNATNATNANYAETANYATNANFANTAANSTNAGHADTATTANSATNATNADTLDGWHIDATSTGVDTQWIAAFVPGVEGNWSKGTVRAMDSSLFARKTDLENVKLTATGDRYNPIFINAEGKPEVAENLQGILKASVSNNVLTLTII